MVVRFACATTSERKSGEELRGKKLTVVVEALICVDPITIAIAAKYVIE